MRHRWQDNNPTEVWITRNTLLLEYSQLGQTGVKLSDSSDMCNQSNGILFLSKLLKNLKIGCTASLQVPPILSKLLKNLSLSVSKILQ